MSPSTIAAQGINRPAENIKFTRGGRGVSNIRDARDHPLVKPVPCFVDCSIGERGFWNPTNSIVRWDYINNQPDFAGKKLDLEGEVTRITYLARTLQCRGFCQFKK